MNSPSLLARNTPVQSSGLEGRVLSTRKCLYSLANGGPEAHGGSCVDTCPAYHLACAWTKAPKDRSRPSGARILQVVWAHLPPAGPHTLWEPLWPGPTWAALTLAIARQECHPSREALPRRFLQPRGAQGRGLGSGKEMDLLITSPKNFSPSTIPALRRGGGWGLCAPCLPRTVETGCRSTTKQSSVQSAEELYFHIPLCKSTEKIWRDTQWLISGEGMIAVYSLCYCSV